MQRFGASQKQSPVGQPEQYRAMNNRNSKLSSDLWDVKLYADRQDQDTSTLVRRGELLKALAVRDSAPATATEEHESTPYGQSVGAGVVAHSIEEQLGALTHQPVAQPDSSPAPGAVKATAWSGVRMKV